MFSANGPFAPFKWAALFKDFHIFVSGLGCTLLIALAALALAVALGVLFGLLSTSNVKPLRMLARTYVEFIQNTPLLIQVFFLYNGLPFLGMTLDVTTIGILGVGVYHGAYVAEVVRTGVQSTSRGQFEAAYSQGFTYWPAMFHIILPQALKVMLPPFTNQVVNLVKNTSVIAIISGADIMFAANSWSGSNLYYGPAYVTAGALYFVLCFPLAKLATMLETRAKSPAGRQDYA